MTIEILPHALSVCRYPVQPLIPEGFVSFSRTGDEYSLVCETNAVPAGYEAREDGWLAFRIAGVLDFSLIGILAKITTILAENGISIFAISTYNTDYVLFKEEALDSVIRALKNSGYDVST